MDVVTTWEKLNKITSMIEHMTERIENVASSVSELEKKYDTIEAHQKEMKEMITSAVDVIMEPFRRLDGIEGFDIIEEPSRRIRPTDF